MTLFVAFAVPADLDEWADKILGEENGFSRAITFSNVPVMASTIYGDVEKVSVEQWIEDSDKTYEITRTTPWKSKIPSIEDNEDDDSDGPKPSVGDAPEGLFDLEKLRHSDYKVMTPIDVRKWDAAKWRAVLFMTQPGSDAEPVMALTFMEREPAEAIFQGWRERFGEHDPEDALRVCIITGIKISNPHAYAVIVGPNVRNIRGGKGNIIGFVSRIQIMTPKDSKNLDMFLSEYRRHGRFLLAGGYLPDLKGTPEPLLDAALGKYHLEVRPAWTVGENDPDSSALDLEDPPFIPLDEVNAPALRALESLARFRGKK